MASFVGRTLAAGLSLATVSGALTITQSDPNSVKQVASTIAANMVSYYSGNKPGNAPGLLPNSGQAGGYGWWEGGEFFGALVQYWYLTGDSQYNDITVQALEFQRGENNDYNPRNYSQYLGNDDISFWAIAAMDAVETVFPPPAANVPSYLALVQAVWNEQQALWDLTSCNGGLRWQRTLFSAGYRYKNSITEGTFFQIGARLGAYTGNQTYIDWAEKTWDWSSGVGLVDAQYNVWDGADTTGNCTGISHLAWTYNIGVYLYGAAVMWNVTGDDAKWRPRIQGLLNAANQFFPNSSTDAVSGVMVETACETINTCNVDQLSFKSNLSRWMWQTAIVARWTEPIVRAKLASTITAAAASCQSSGQCGFKWTTGGYDNSPGIGQQLNALQTVMGLLLDQVPGPVTAKTGGTSVGDPSAGTNVNSDSSGSVTYGAVTGGQKAGAGILTAIFIIGTLGGAFWMLK